MTTTPPQGTGDTTPTGPGPAFESPSHGQYGAASGSPASAAPSPDPTAYGQPVAGSSPSQPGTSYGTPVYEAYTGTQGYSEPYADQAPADPYAGTQGHADPYAGTRGYADPYAGPQGYGAPPAQAQGYAQPYAAPYAPTHGYAEPSYEQTQGYAAPYAAQGYQQPGAYAGYAMAPTGMTAPLPTGMAVAAMVCGIVGVALSLCGGWSIPLSIVGIVLGALGQQKAKRGEAGGRGMALAGVITGSVGLAISVVVILIYILAMLATR